MRPAISEVIGQCETNGPHQRIYGLIDQWHVDQWISVRTYHMVMAGGMSGLNLRAEFNSFSAELIGRFSDTIVL
jgi:hypothetical protein